MQRSACVLRHRKNILCARPTFRTRIAARGEHSALAANNPRAYCGAWTIFRARSQRLARVLRRGDNIPRAQPTICTRIGARGEHSARAANNPLAYCSAGGHSARAANKPHACRGARRTFQALSQEPVGNLKTYVFHRALRGSVTNAYFANNMHACFGARRTRGEYSARAAIDRHAYCGVGRIFRARSQWSARVLRHSENIPRAQPTTHARIAAREHSARAANDSRAYCGAGRTLRARGQRSAPVLRCKENIPRAERARVHSGFKSFFCALCRKNP